jgi:diadenosine tetraphosphatase ApaH/serine/threonine PP2A family protein phosphatase
MAKTVAVISDIHSNLEALDAVWAHIAGQGIETIFCLGDVVGYGPDPCACLDRIMECEFTIMGNHDHAVFMEPTGFNTPAENAVFWTRRMLDEEPDEARRRRRWEFVARLVEYRETDSVLFVHGSPRRPMHEYLFPDEAELSMTRLMEVFDLLKHVCFVGHTHLPGVFTEQFEFMSPSQVGHKLVIGDRKVIINVGSVGQPRDLDPRACYATITGREVRWHRVAYDYKKTMEKILATNVLDAFLANRLAEGR